MTLITSLPEVATSNLRELQWSVDWWARKYAEAGYNSDVAWSMYGDAIDNEDSQVEIENLFEIAEMFDGIKRDTWRNWDNAKAQYLAMMN